MNIPVIGFIPPIKGVNTEFNTFRLGLKWSKTLSEGTEVLLMDEKGKFVFGRAVVTRIVTGELKALCDEHAKSNHRELANEPEGASDRLYAYLHRLFGPHIVNHNKKTTVVYMKRTE